MSRKPSNPSRLTSAALLAAVVALVGFLAYEPTSPAKAPMAQASYDRLFAQLGLGRSTPLDSVALIYLDVDSFSSRGLDPGSRWPRKLHAQLLDRLTRAGARAVVFDVVFDVPDADPQIDRQLAEAIRRNGRVILAAERPASSQDRSAARTVQKRLVLPTPALLAAAAGWGLSDLNGDEDFVVRRHFDLAPVAGEPRPSLASATAGSLQLASADGGPRPATDRWVRYYGPPLSLPHFSMRQALDDAAVSDAEFRDKIVFIGARPGPWARQLTDRRDEFRSPFKPWGARDAFMPGVEVHATQLLNLVRGDWLGRVPARLEILGLLAVALGAGALLWLKPIQATAVTAAMAGLLTLAAAGLAASKGLWFAWLVPVAVQLPTALAGSFLHHSLDWYRARKQFEAARRIAEARIREQATLIEKANDAILLQDLQGGIRYANPGAEQLYGWTLAELQEGAAVRLFPAADPQLQEARRTTLNQGHWQGELHQQTRDGKDLAIESRWTLIQRDDPSPPSMLLINRDVTLQRQLEAETLRMQRMEGIGALAGGIAHDLNNALAPILMGTQILRPLAPAEAAQRVLNLMEASTRRSADMVRQVLLFARGSAAGLQPLNPRSLVREVEKLARETFPRSIQVQSFVAADLWNIRGDATQLHQVLLNLCVNARDAMPRGGKLSLMADNVTLTEADASAIPGAAPGDFVSVGVSDTGTGIPPEVLPRIFEPFFTTKPEGQGTGLGLSTTARILKAHGGFVAVRSQPGEGTEFEVFLPRLPETANAPAPQELAPPPRGDGELILLADDDQAIREMLRRGLEDHGYRVATAANGAEAVRVFKDKSPEIALVLCDTAMPLVSGPEALAAMEAIRPGLRSLLMSGEDSPAGPGTDGGGSQVREPRLQKPFSLAELLQQVAALLHKPS